jgi:hypothetical protein
MSQLTPDLYALSQKDASRLTLAGDIARAAGWPVDLREIECYAFFRSNGELLCSPITAKTAQGQHPFHRVVSTIQEPGLSEVLSLDDLPAAAALAMPYRFRTFFATWVSGHSQINLKLGAAYLSQLGWIGEDRPPIYPIAMQQIVGLYSQSKIQETYGIEISDI